MHAKQNTMSNARASPGWERWKKEMKDNRMGFFALAIWMAMGIPVIYFALMFR